MSVTIYSIPGFLIFQRNKVLWKTLKWSPRIPKTILKKKNIVWGITLLYVRAHYVAVIIKTTWYWWRKRLIDQWKRTENPDAGLHSINVNILVVVLYCSFAECYHWWELGKDTRDFSILFLIYACQLSQNKNFNLEWS